MTKPGDPGVITMVMYVYFVQVQLTRGYTVVHAAMGYNYVVPVEEMGENSWSISIKARSVATCLLVDSCTALSLDISCRSDLPSSLVCTLK